jgi:exosortase C (VPDSG-CTERM-specific)
MAPEAKNEGMGTPTGPRGGAWANWMGQGCPQRLRLRLCAGYLVILTLSFSFPLFRLVVYAAQSQLHSHVLLVPFVTGCLLFLQRKRPRAECRTSFPGTAAMAAIGIGALSIWLGWRGSLSVNDGLAVMALAFVSLVAAGGFLFFGSKWMAQNAFPVAFLIFMVPLPDAVVNWLENASALASASAAGFYFQMAGTSFFRQGTVFELPGISIRVAQECSGIHSSWVLFIVSLLASHLFLRNGWRKAALVAFVIPLGILRNGFRILTIGLLCVHIGPEMIDSPIHRQGGPLFFALSLIPLYLVLWWLRRQEQRPKRSAEAA